jgi:hypothetical protein
MISSKGRRDTNWGFSGTLKWREGTHAKGTQMTDDKMEMIRDQFLS